VGDREFEALVERARLDDEVLALVLGGGRGKGLAGPDSDYDVYLVVSDGAGRPPDRPAGIELVQLTLGEFERHAAFGSEDEWNRYTFAHVTATVDKTGGAVQRLLDEMESIPADLARSTAASSLDDYLNLTYRSRKSRATGDGDAATLDAAESVGPLLTYLFATEARIRPYNKFLRWELVHHPLRGAPWGADELVGLAVAVSRADDASQARATRGAADLARRVGLGDVVRAWGAAALEVLGLTPDAGAPA
jgi:hypothetical protein